ncbi:MAG: PEP-CTERM-box response regulator transcription factor [Gammaproteobacteria bacterium]|nr:PEP-CTERM-box response regulator transcription factor [Gammaproteobacteria bacterium]
MEDDIGLQRQLKWSFNDYDVVLASNRNEAIAALRKHKPLVVTLDLGLPPDPANVSEGFATLSEIISIAPETKVIVITGNDDVSNAIEAVSLGAYDFYQKPIDPEVIKIIIERAFHVSLLEQEVKTLQQQSAADSPLEGLITADPEMLKICRIIEKVAPTDTTVLLIGESGTGKEVLANALHRLSQRKNGNFIAINCAAIPENLLESELFGYEKGAFTGATKQTKGKLELADKGTLFLDEIGDLPLQLQAKLLRFLQERTLERVGGREKIQVDARVISATHQDLQQMISEKSFRQDLYYRLSDLTIHIPPLRERKGDVSLLARVFFEKHKALVSNSIKGLTKNSIYTIENHSWPGNVRELEAVIKRAVIMAESSYIDEKDLGLQATGTAVGAINLRDVREKAEKDAIRYALNVTQDNISQAAELLGVSRPTLYDLIKKYHLK